VSNIVGRPDLQVADCLTEFVGTQALPGTGVAPDRFWQGFADIVAELGPVNRALLEERARLQREIDAWHKAHRADAFDVAAYRTFLGDTGYLEPAGDDVAITSENVDPEIATLAGPQLVVPLSNARFALNAANARWGSLYDALYGTDAVSHDGALAPGKSYNAERGAEVVARGAAFLDQAVPLAGGSHRDAQAYTLVDNNVHLQVTLADGAVASLSNLAQFVGHNGAAGGTQSLMFAHHGLHIELQFDPAHPIGGLSASGLKDIVVEAALSTIQDCEDSVTAVDAEDKVAVYANWLGLMAGDLEETFEKGGNTLTRRLNADKSFIDGAGRPISLTGRSVQLVRNVGHLMTTDAVLDANGDEIPEGFLDAMVTTLCALHDLKKSDGMRNSRTGSIYVVKPKMHGAAEAALANDLFARVEDALGLARNTVKIGLMDEERRTSINLNGCIRALKDRLVFINTGFLDRTGDEIHTCMHAGPVMPKSEMKQSTWFPVYEDNNVDVGLATGMAGRGQIGKGMWAKPDDMADMLATKQEHPMAGANTAWVPSPIAAVLHALHYHEVDVAARQAELAARAPADLNALLTPPLLGDRVLSPQAIAREIDNNCQSILGYVVRWVDQGVGCSKVPDIDDVAMMEDRATLRISAQQLANWLLHGLCTRDQVAESFRRMAVAVDRQNRNTPGYQPMAADYEASIAFEAAQALVFDGVSQPSGYTEPILHRHRRAAKAHAAATS
jgi:malate synthase